LKHLNTLDNFLVIMDSIKVMKTFDEKSIPTLDVAVLAALELFMKQDLPKIEVPYKRPLVVGSGNAEATGRIVFANYDAVYASESNFGSKLHHIKNIDGIVLFSASGAKHAHAIAKRAKELEKPVTLITNTPHSPAEKELDLKGGDRVLVLPKNREPYSYNTSTYLGMILTQTHEKPREIYDFIQEKISKINFSAATDFDKMVVVVPSVFSQVKRMIHLKFIELFGREIARDIETAEFMKHATTIVKSEELFIVFGNDPRKYGEHQINIPLPKHADYGSIMAIGYYVMGKIQSMKKPYFAHDLVDYCKEASKLFGEEIKPIVE
jgi:hypothetical protein